MPSSCLAASDKPSIGHQTVFFSAVPCPDQCRFSYHFLILEAHSKETIDIHIINGQAAPKRQNNSTSKLFCICAFTIFMFLAYASLQANLTKQLDSVEAKTRSPGEMRPEGLGKRIILVHLLAKQAEASKLSWKNIWKLYGPLSSIDLSMAWLSMICLTKSCATWCWLGQ